MAHTSLPDDERPDPALLGDAQAYASLLAALAGEAELSEVARLAAAWAMHLLRCEGGSVTMRRGDEAEYIAAVGLAAPVIGRSIPLADSFTGNVLLSGRAAIFDPTRGRDASRERATQDTISSGIVAPLIVAGEAVGTLGVASRQPLLFGPDDVAMLRSLGTCIAIGLGLVTMREGAPVDDGLPPEVRTRLRDLSAGLRGDAAELVAAADLPNEAAGLAARINERAESLETLVREL